MSSTSFPSSFVRNSPFELRSLSAFHCLGLWLAVIIMPPSALDIVTASSVVGVVASPILRTSTPIPIKVPHIMFLTISPEMRPSRPTTIFNRLPSSAFFLINVAYADVNFTISKGFRVSPGRPPIVPRIPDIDLINVIGSEILSVYLFTSLEG